MAKAVCAQVTEDIVKITPQLDDEDYTCPICSTIAWRPIRLDCQHVLCTKCTIELQKTFKYNCPMCRRKKVVKEANEGKPNFCSLFVVPVHFAWSGVSDISGRLTYLNSWNLSIVEKSPRAENLWIAYLFWRIANLGLDLCWLTSQTTSTTSWSRNWRSISRRRRGRRESSLRLLMGLRDLVQVINIHQRINVGWCRLWSEGVRLSGKGWHGRHDFLCIGYEACLNNSHCLRYPALCIFDSA